ncbi:type III pantothenate kinase [Flavobacterium sp. RHBU_24]|uniref:type III pantothenate kinase n=1 Tax=Flavobacterium sp. RHBU_24 TaxID=3391185 RepID=UPI003984FD02
MLLAVDIGNTKIKAAVFEGAALLERFSFSPGGALAEAEKIIVRYPGLANSIISTVGKEDSTLLLWLREHTEVTEVSHEMVFPFINKYATPHTLGIDRMVLAAGAVLRHPGQNRLVIDAGTCVTYDFTDAGDNYLGGAISPGLQLRYNAMHTFTAKLPLLYPEMPQSYIGNATAMSIHVGAVNGLLYEIQGFIDAYSKEYQPLTVILTGGDADFLAKRLKSTIFANSNFMLESLNQLYLYTITNLK